MNADQRKRYEELLTRLRDAVAAVEELPDGYAFRFAPDADLFMAAAEFITLESRCCSFYRFTLEKEPGEEAIWLRVTGAEAAKSFIREALAPTP